MTAASTPRAGLVDFALIVLAPALIVCFLLGVGVYLAAVHPDVDLDVRVGRCVTHYRHWPIGGEDEWSTGCR